MDNLTWRRVVSFGTEGTEAGNFCRPWGVAITRYSDLVALSPPAKSDYLIAIADRSNNRIQVFKFDAIRSSVTFLHMFGEGPGTRHGQFDRPAGIVFNPVLEHIIVTDKDNHRVQVFDLSGSYLFKFGERGSKSGQFCYPWDIDVCGITHNILVSDTRNRRVQVFNKLGRYITHFNQPLDSPRGVAYLGPSQVLVSDFNKHRLVMIVQSDDEQVTSSTSLVATSGNNGTDYLNNRNNNNNNNLSNNLAQDKTITRSHYPPAPVAQAGKVQQTFYESKFIGFGEGSSWGEFLRPQGVTANGSNVFCSDSRNNRVACWNKDTQSFNYISKDIVDLDRPAGLAAIDNYIVIVDFGNNRVHICQYLMNMDSYNWRRVVSFGCEGTETGNFCRPWGVAIARFSDLVALSPPAGSDYLIAIADRSNNRIQVFKFDAIRSSVTFLHMFGEGPGTRHGQFDRPAGIVFNPFLEHIIVTDKDNHRVQVFDLSGSYLFKFGERGSKSGQFCYPWDIDVCATTHNILVSDTRNRRVQIFNKLGRYLTHFNQPLDSPRGVAYLGPSQVLVSDFNKHRLVMIVQSDDEQVTSSTSLVATSGNNGTDYLNNRNNNNNNNLSNNLAQDKTITRSHYPPAPVAQAGKVQQTFYESKFIGFGEGSSWGEFLRPQGVTANGSNVFCSDSRNNRVVRWNKDTQTFSYLSKEIVDLDRPAGLAAIDNYIVIVDFGNNRVHICQNTDMQAF